MNICHTHEFINMQDEEKDFKKSIPDCKWSRVLKRDLTWLIFCRQCRLIFHYRGHCVDKAFNSIKKSYFTTWLRAVTEEGNGKPCWHKTHTQSADLFYVLCLALLTAVQDYIDDLSRRRQSRQITGKTPRYGGGRERSVLSLHCCVSDHVPDEKRKATHVADRFLLSMSLVSQISSDSRISGSEFDSGNFFFFFFFTYGSCLQSRILASDCQSCWFGVIYQFPPHPLSQPIQSDCRWHHRDWGGTLYINWKTDQGNLSSIKALVGVTYPISARPQLLSTNECIKGKLNRTNVKSKRRVTWII